MYVTGLAPNTLIPSVDFAVKQPAPNVPQGQYAVKIVLDDPNPSRFPLGAQGAAAIYTGGDRVLYDGVGYQAKWWTQGDVPGVATTVPSDTPWQLLTS